MSRVVKLTSFILVILLMGCASQGKEEVSFLPDTSKGKEKESATDELGQGVEHIEDNSNPNIVFDADVNIPDSAKTGELYTADIEPIQMQTKTEETLKVFEKYIENGKYKESESVHHLTGIKTDYVSFEMKSPETGLSILSDGRLLFRSMYGDAVQSLFKCDDMMPHNNLDKFKQQDLDFMSREEASKYVKEQLNELGLDVLDECKIYSMTAEELIAAKEKYLKESPGDADVMIKEALAIKEWYDGYYMVFNFHLDGVPFVDEEFHFQSYQGAVIPTSAVVTLSEEGFIALHVNAGQAINKSESPKTILDLREAMDALVKYYDLVIIPEPILVTKISMRYMQYKQGSQNIIPTYQFKVMQGDWPMYIYINAFTGERII